MLDHLFYTWFMLASFLLSVRAVNEVCKVKPDSCGVHATKCSRPVCNFEDELM